MAGKVDEKKILASPALAGGIVTLLGAEPDGCDCAFVAYVEQKDLRDSSQQTRANEI